MVGEGRVATAGGIRNKETLRDVGVGISAELVDSGVRDPINMPMLLLLKVAPERQFNPS